MFRRSVLIVGVFAAFLSTQKTQAQTPPPDLPACFVGLADATVGIPYSCDYGTALNQYLAPFFQASGVSIAFNFSVTKGSTLPPGLSLTPSGLLSGTPTTNGTFDFSLDINFSISVSGQVVQETSPFPSTLQVGGAATGTTIVAPSGLVFSLSQAAGTSSQNILLFSRRSSPVTYTASVTTATPGAAWLSVSPGGTINPFQSTTASATVNASGLPAGTYAGTISLALSTGENFTIPVVLTVTGAQRSLILSQTGFYFETVQGGPTAQSQTISVLNGGSGSLNFTASATVAGGANWLSVSPATGTASSTTSGSVAVNINSTGLAPGTYYGQINIAADGVPNSPKTATVVLSVVSPAQSPGPSLNVTGLVLVQTGSNVSSTRPLTISNPSPNALNFSTSVSADSGAGFFTASPASGTLTAGQPVSITVQPTTGLASGVYTGNLSLIFTDAATQTIYQHRVAVALIVVPSSVSAARPAGGLAPRAQTCAPTKLVLVATQLGNSFKVPAAWPAPLEITSVDDCGSFMTQGSVVSAFSNGDPPLIMASLQDGRWSGTWVPRGTSSTQVTITVQARQMLPPLQGTTQLGGTLDANPSVPAIDAGGVVSAASYVQRQPLAPGSYIAIFGHNLNPGQVPAASLPLQTQLGGTQVILGGKALPLNYAGTTQINALVPFDTPINSDQQVIVQQGSQLSAPEPIVISPAQPAIFTFPGAGPVVLDYRSTDPYFIVDATHPVTAGDVLVIYCTGLGPVNQAVAVGTAGPSNPPANVLNTVTATIGGVGAPVLFAGLAPTLTVYQVNIRVPEGVTPGAGVSLVLSQVGQQSVPVQLPVK